MPRPIDAQLRSILHCRQLYRVHCHACQKNSPPNCLRTLAHSGPIYLAHFIGNFAGLEKNLRFKEFIKRFWMFKNQKPFLPALKYRNWNATAHLADLRGGGGKGAMPPRCQPSTDMLLNSISVEGCWVLTLAENQCAWRLQETELANKSTEHKRSFRGGEHSPQTLDHGNIFLNTVLLHEIW